jgi:proline- and glutamine-rich splicing factor
MLQPPSAFTQEIPKKKFTTRCRLFVGNLPNEMKEEDFKKLFTEFGEISEVFLSGKGFGFLRLVSHFLMLIF